MLIIIYDYKKSKNTQILPELVKMDKNAIWKNAKTVVPYFDIFVEFCGVNVDPLGSPQKILKKLPAWPILEVP